MALEKIPTEPFDAARHVLVCREACEGRQVFVTLESIVAAEAKIEAPQILPAQEAPDLSAYVTRDEIAGAHEALKQAVFNALPPLALPAEILATITEMARAVAAMRGDGDEMKKKLLELERQVSAQQESFRRLDQITGGEE